jgi:CopG family transcriptional regulator / antitoxin EndoAI
MARINLRIASESFPLEQEAGGTVERLVSGV